MDIEQATALTQGDTLNIPVRVLTVKPSDHSYFGPHDVVTVEVTEAAGDLPSGLRFQMRRPHDGSADLRSDARKERKGKATEADLPTPTAEMNMGELRSIADARGVDVPTGTKKAGLLRLLGV